MARIVLDTGAVIALASRQPRARAYIDRARRRKDDIVIPSVVVVEATRGTAVDAPINQVFNEIGVPFLAIRDREPGSLQDSWVATRTR